MFKIIKKIVIIFIILSFENKWQFNNKKIERNTKICAQSIFLVLIILALFQSDSKMATSHLKLLLFFFQFSA